MTQPEKRNGLDVTFCERCEVSLDLHPFPDEDDPAERGCTIAERKADQINAFWGFGQ